MTATPTDQAYQTTFSQLSSLQEYVGKELGLTEWVTIDQNRIQGFADTTEDQQWIHVDAEKAQQDSPYGCTIAHGFLVLSLASKFAYESYAIDNVGMAVNYGLDRVRFPSATLVGAAIRGRVSLMEYKEIPGGARYKTQITFEIKGQEKPACIAECIAQVYTK